MKTLIFILIINTQACLASEESQAINAIVKAGRKTSAGKLIVKRTDAFVKENLDENLVSAIGYSQLLINQKIKFRESGMEFEYDIKDKEIVVQTVISF